MIALINSLLPRVAEVNVPACDINSSELGCAHVVGPAANSGQVTSILQIVFGVIGVIAVIVIIIAGFQLMISLGGNPDAAKKARDTIIYAAIGLAVAVSAEFIVSFVLGKI